ncbi:Dyp-type peroxidase [Rhodococcus sp. MSC1_016]|jgi:putative iron-dependent peroxidase|uniref:Dyp-type peroxidase n=1 Tax=Rhodococcus sp. MSC1_016 TaxID=2909266 RepID=UPI00202F431E|nr:Dyp-type peroxidase [Rhodococcus sp. MSC1_016]
MPGPVPRLAAQAVLTPPSAASLFLVVVAGESREDAVTVRDVVADLESLLKAVGFRELSGSLSCVVGIGSEFWDRVSPAAKPALLHRFLPLSGPVHSAPSTPGDVLFHIKAARADLCFELGRLLVAALGSAATVVDEVSGFRYFDARDLLGFVDGTENPTDADADEAALIGDEDPDFRGGSYVIVQKYLHDMSAWTSLSVTEQERVIGRTKLENVELDEDAQPGNSHVALNTIVDDEGVEHQILRDNMPFGSLAAGEFGTYFIGYARDPGVTELMLRRMFLGEPPGNYDRILDFSTAVTGTLFFVPSRDVLESLADEPESAEAPSNATGEAEQPDPYDLSLNIGGLKGVSQ